MSIQGQIANWQMFNSEDEDVDWEQVDSFLDDISDEADKLDEKVWEMETAMKTAISLLLNGQEGEALKLLQHIAGHVEEPPMPSTQFVREWWVGGRSEMRGEAPRAS